MATRANLDNLTDEEKRHWTTRSKAAIELVDTEETYVDGIRNLYETFYTRLNTYSKLDKDIIDDDFIPKIFMNLPAIYNMNQALLQELRKLRYNGAEALIGGVGDVLVKYVPYFKIYVDYVAEYPVAQDVLEKLSRNKKWVEFLELNEMCAGTDFASLLILPIQRVPRYVMLVSEISKHSVKINGIDTQNEELDKSVKILSEVAEHINNHVKHMEARKAVVNMQDKLFRNEVQLVSPTRFHVHHTNLKKVYNRGFISIGKREIGRSHKKYMFILFNDILIYCTRPGSVGEGSYCRFKHALPLATISCKPLDEAPTMKKGECPFEINNTASGAKSFIVLAPDEETRSNWIQKIEEYAEISLKHCQTIKKNPQTVEEIESTILKNTPETSIHRRDSITLTEEEKTLFAPARTPVSRVKSEPVLNSNIPRNEGQPPLVSSTVPTPMEAPSNGTPAGPPPMTTTILASSGSGPAVGDYGPPPLTTTILNSIGDVDSSASSDSSLELDDDFSPLRPAPTQYHRPLPSLPPVAAAPPAAMPPAAPPPGVAGDYGPQPTGTNLTVQTEATSPRKSKKSGKKRGSTKHGKKRTSVKKKGGLPVPATPGLPVPVSSPPLSPSLSPPLSPPLTPPPRLSDFSTTQLGAGQPTYNKPLPKMPVSQSAPNLHEIKEKKKRKSLKSKSSKHRDRSRKNKDKTHKSKHKDKKDKTRKHKSKRNISPMDPSL